MGIRTDIKTPHESVLKYIVTDTGSIVNVNGKEFSMAEWYMTQFC